MAELNKVRVQVLDPTTGQVIENVDVKTSDGAVYLPDGTTLRQWINNTENAHSEFQKKLAEHMNSKHVDTSKVDQLLTGVEYDESNGQFKITNHKGEEKIIDTALEKLAVNFTMRRGEDGTEEEGKVFLVLTLDDDSTMEVEVTELVDIYTGSTGEQIIVTIGTDGAVGATLVDKSIGMDKLTDEVVAAIAAQYQLVAATTESLGGVIVGDGLAVTADGTLSTKNVTKDGVATNLNFVADTDTVVLTIDGPTDALVSATVGATVNPLTVTVTKTGSASEAAVVSYQWYKKTVGTDVAFTAIGGATADTLASANIDTSTAGTTIYYCRASVAGEGVVADPVASKQVTVVVA